MKLTHYRNHDYFEILFAVSEQLIRYFNACENEGVATKAVEANINEKLLPLCEQVILQDILEGGVHDYEYMRGFNQVALLIDDSFIMCNYQAAQFADKVIMKKCRRQGDFDRIEEGNKVLQMIDDLNQLSIKDFVKKYYVPRNYVKVDMLLNSFMRFFNVDNFNLTDIGETFINGRVDYDNIIKAALQQFFIANKLTAYKYVNGELYDSGHPVDHICADMCFERNNESEDFRLQSISIKLFFSKEESIKTCYKVENDQIPEVSSKQFGKLITDQVYPLYEPIVLGQKGDYDEHQRYRKVVIDGYENKERD